MPFRRCLINGVDAFWGAGAGAESVTPAGVEPWDCVDSCPLDVAPPLDVAALAVAATVADAMLEPSEGRAPDVPVVVEPDVELTERKDEIVIVDP